MALDDVIDRRFARDEFYRNHTEFHYNCPVCADHFYFCIFSLLANGACLVSVTSVRISDLLLCDSTRIVHE